MTIQFTNGGFEAGQGFRGYRELNDQGDMNIYAPGWTLVSGSVDVIDHTIQGPTVGMDLHGSSAGAVEQTLDTSSVPIGTEITFSIRARSPDGDDLMTVSVNGVDLIAQGQTTATFHPTSGPGYQTYTFTFLSTGSDTVRITGSGGAPNSGVYFDNVTVVCFHRGTQIETKTGNVPVENLKVGDLVLTDCGYQPLRLALRRCLNSKDFKANPKLYPVRISAGSLGGNLPKTDLWVSRQHRMLSSSSIAKRMFGNREVLVSAIKLTELPGISVDDSVEEAEYFHLVFDQHLIVFANGAPSESFYPGQEALKTLCPDAREEFMTLFPMYNERDCIPVSARYIPKGKHQHKLVVRHLKNGKEFLSSKATIETNQIYMLKKPASRLEQCAVTDFEPQLSSSFVTG